MKTRTSINSFNDISLSVLRHVFLNYLQAKRFNGESFIYLNNFCPKNNIDQIKKQLSWAKIDSKLILKNDYSKLFQDRIEQLISEGYAYPEKDITCHKGTNRNMNPIIALDLFINSGYSVRLKIPDGFIEYKDTKENLYINGYDPSTKDPIIYHQCTNSYTDLFTDIILDIENKVTHNINQSCFKQQSVYKAIISEYLGYQSTVDTHINDVIFSEYTLDKKIINILEMFGFKKSEIYLQNILTVSNLKVYQELGFNPESLLCALYDGKYHTMTEMENEFKPKQELSLNFDKISRINGKFIDDPEIFLDYFNKAKIYEPKEKLFKIINTCKSICHYYAEILNYNYFFERPEISVSFKEMFEDCYESIKIVHDELEKLSNWSFSEIENVLNNHNRLSLNIRILIIGDYLGSNTSKAMEIIGKEETLYRLKNYSFTGKRQDV